MSKKTIDLLIVGIGPAGITAALYGKRTGSDRDTVVMRDTGKVLIEVMYKADYCLPCFYMDETVREILPKYVDEVEYHRVDFMKGEGKKRFMELSFSLFGEENVRKHCRVAPIPSLFIDGELVFDAIPPIFELEEALDEALRKRKSATGGNHHAAQKANSRSTS